MDETDTGNPRYRWPWYLLAAVILGLVLAVVWMSFAVREVREMRRARQAQQATSAAVPETNASGTNR